MTLDPLDTDTPFQARLRSALKNSTAGIQELAEQCGVTKQAVYNLLNPPAGRVVNGCSYVAELARALKVSPGWLQFGDGGATTKPAPALQAVSLEGLSAIQALVVTALADLCRDSKVSDGEALDILAQLRTKLT